MCSVPLLMPIHLFALNLRDVMEMPAAKGLRAGGDQRPPGIFCKRKFEHVGEVRFVSFHPNRSIMYD